MDFSFDVDFEFGFDFDIDIDVEFGNRFFDVCCDYYFECGVDVWCVFFLMLILFLVCGFDFRFDF